MVPGSALLSPSPPDSASGPRWSRASFSRVPLYATPNPDRRLFVSVDQPRYLTVAASTPRPEAPRSLGPDRRYGVRAGLRIRAYPSKGAQRAAELASPSARPPPSSPSSRLRSRIGAFGRWWGPRVRVWHQLHFDNSHEQSSSRADWDAVATQLGADRSTIPPKGRFQGQSSSDVNLSTPPAVVTV